MNYGDNRMKSLTRMMAEFGRGRDKKKRAKRLQNVLIGSNLTEMNPVTAGVAGAGVGMGGKLLVDSASKGVNALKSRSSQIALSPITGKTMRTYGKLGAAGLVAGVALDQLQKRNLKKNNFRIPSGDSNRPIYVTKPKAFR